MRASEARRMDSKKAERQVRNRDDGDAVNNMHRTSSRRMVVPRAGLGTSRESAGGDGCVSAGRGPDRSHPPKPRIRIPSPVFKIRPASDPPAGLLKPQFNYIDLLIHQHRDLLSRQHRKPTIRPFCPEPTVGGQSSSSCSVWHLAGKRRRISTFSTEKLEALFRVVPAALRYLAADATVGLLQPEQSCSTPRDMNRAT